jgi:putative hydrolase of the HAD superfamily
MKTATNVCAVTFDVGGTLLEPWPSVGHVYAKTAARHGIRGVSAEILNQRFAAAWRRMENFNYSRVEWEELVDATFQGLTDAPPSQTFFGELYDYFAQSAAWRVFDDVLPALDALASRGLKLGVISNWDERVRPLLQQFKLADYFDAVIVSCEVGFPKPSPVIFEHASVKLALPPEAILHVGDSAEVDVEGARNAGLQTLELRREIREPGNGQIQGLCEIEDCLNRLSQIALE